MGNLIELNPSDSFACFSEPNDDDHHLFLGDFQEINSPTETCFSIRPFGSVDKRNFGIIPDQIVKNPELLFTQVSTPSNTTDETNRSAYTSQVRAIVDQLDSNLKKVVLSRVKSVQIDQESNLVQLYQDLKNKHPNTLTYLINSPSFGTWIGSTPEILLCQDGSDTRTMALAGTQAVPDSGKVNFSTWGQKEIEEQELVSKHLRSVLGSTIFSESRPSTLIAGPVAHIVTNFFSSSELDFWKLACQLHPTPAIAGLPVDKSLTVIRQLEQHQRELYTGFLGPMNFNNHSALYVNLRCTKVLEKSFQLFLGAGITRDSDPQKEWEETELKAQTLLSVIKKIHNFDA